MATMPKLLRCLMFYLSLYLPLCLMSAVSSAALAKDIPRFVPPKERASMKTERLRDGTHFLSLSYHNVEDDDPDQTFLGVRTDRLIAQLTWLREHGYQAVSVDQILAARDGGERLPNRAVLLSFDDGFSSFYKRVFPILTAFNWPAVLAPAGTWIDTPDEQIVDFGSVPTARDQILTWAQIAEMSRSGLIEIGAHTYKLHQGELANPQGNLQPAAAVHLWNAQTGYEDDAAYDARLREDVRRITERITAATGKPPRVWVWPYGAAGGRGLAIVREFGYQMSLTLDDGLGKLDELDSVPRFLLANDPSISRFAQYMADVEHPMPLRVIHIDLDAIYDPDPAVVDQRLGELVQRVYDLRISAVFLQAFVSPVGDGPVKELYFPNRWLPMRADLFNRVAWQLRSRGNVEALYAWMPVLGFELDPALPRVVRLQPEGGASDTAQDPAHYARLSPFDPTVRSRVADIYEDLARHAMFDGVLYHDDAMLSEFEDVGPAAMAAYAAAGLPNSPQALRADPETLQRWTRFKSRYLVDFTAELTKKVRAMRGPEVKTARHIYPEPILDPASEVRYAQNLDDFLGAYTWTAPLAVPRLAGVAPDQVFPWLDRLVDTVAKRPGALSRTLFEVQAVDWRQPRRADTHPPVPPAVLAQWMQRLQLRGVRNFGYYPDDFINQRLQVGAIDSIRPVLSNAWYPHP
jgi:biofilm PGA synthesis lipoprotein PgaB